MNELRRGTAYGVGAYLLWGLFALYFPLLKPASSVEIVAHRIVWSLLFLLVILGVQRNWGWLRELAADRRSLAILVTAAVLIAANWCLYIYGVNSKQVVETSLGYFINPLVTVLLGVVVLGERLRRTQWAAIGLGAIAVVVLAVDYGRPPWIALGLAFSFGLYGFLKNRVGGRVGAVQSLTVETAVLMLPALIWLVLLERRGDGQFGHSGTGHALLLASTGIVTAVPLILFAAAARRIPLSVIGLLQYLTPVLQFLTGVLLYDEPMPASRLVGFALVWAALSVLTVDSLQNRRRNQRRAAAEASAGAYA
ncbi:MAG: EamA family transporter RarD [Sporichthyaceae bacterium]